MKSYKQKVPDLSRTSPASLQMFFPGLQKATGNDAKRRTS